MKWFLRLGWTAGVMLVTMCVTVLVLWFATRSSNRVIATWPQPVSGADASRYYATILEGQPDTRGFPLSLGRRYVLYVGRESGKPGYGHFVDVSFYPGGEDMESHIGRSRAEWEEDGLRLTSASGHVLFVPEEMYTGGR